MFNIKEKNSRIKDLERKSNGNLNDYVAKKTVEQHQQRNKSIDSDTFDFSSREYFSLYFRIFKFLYFLL
jgi:hypothetical protein